jgi:hypothetical protein
MTTITHAETSPVTDGSQSFLLKRVQPALSGLMDGSLSTLAPIFAVVLATHHPLTAFYTGAATALGAGVSFARSFLAVAVGGAIIASLSAALGVLAAA